MTQQTQHEASSSGHGRRPRIIALINQKGGVGKTTTAVNLGAALTRLDHRVLMIDLDPQAHLSLHLGVDPDQLEHSLYHLLTDPQLEARSILQWVGDASDSAQEAPASRKPKLAVLPAEVNLAGVESELAELVAQGAAQTLLRDKVLPLIEARDGSDGFDYVLLDCPPSLGLLTINALAMAHEVVVPMQAHFLALQGLSKLLETVSLMRQSINPRLQVSGVVLCMHEGQTILAGEVVNDLRSFFEAARGSDVPWRDAQVLQPPVRRNIKLAESPSFGKSIFDYAPDCHGAADYLKLAEALHAWRPVAADPPVAPATDPAIVHVAW